MAGELRCKRGCGVPFARSWASWARSSGVALCTRSTRRAPLSAFYSLFALAPLLLVIVSIAGRTLAEGQARGEIVRQLQGFMGSEAGLAVATLLEKAARAGADAGAVGIVGIVVLALATTAVFLQLQEALNKVWEVAPRPGQMFHALLKRRVASFALVLAAGALLLVSLTLSAALLAITDRLAARMPLPVGLITLGNEVLSFLVLTVLLAVIYRVLPTRSSSGRTSASARSSRRASSPPGSG